MFVPFIHVYVYVSFIFHLTNCVFSSSSSRSPANKKSRTPVEEPAQRPTRGGGRARKAVSYAGMGSESEEEEEQFSDEEEFSEEDAGSDEDWA